jgi:hypothetical protein
MIKVELAKLFEPVVAGTGKNLLRQVISSGVNWRVDEHIPEESGAYYGARRLVTATL